MSNAPPQMRLFALLFVATIAILSLVWFFLLKTEYVLAYENIREADASQIVTELDASGIPYKLANNGHDILVPDDQASDARVAVAGANIALGGTTGFELFNENELGLTEFAQKINLQRAIQGELARTIMMMSGVEFARVHLALPERTLFRSEQESPTAAVTVEMRPGVSLSPASVRGIRQLVASSVPGLAIGSVVVLNNRGGLVSTEQDQSPGSSSQALSEREAVEGLMAIRARAAISNVLPGQPFDIEISAFERLARTPETATDEDGEAISPSAPTRPFGLDGRSLRILVRTPQTLGPEEQLATTMAIVDAIELSLDDGDVLDFSTGALVSSEQTASPSQPAAISRSSNQNSSPANNWWSNASGSWNLTSLFSAWFLIPLSLFVVVLLAIRPRRLLSETETEDFAELLRNSSLDLEAK